MLWAGFWVMGAATSNKATSKGFSDMVPVCVENRMLRGRQATADRPSKEEE